MLDRDKISLNKIFFKAFLYGSPRKKMLIDFDSYKVLKDDIAKIVKSEVGSVKYTEYGEFNLIFCEGKDDQRFMMFLDNDGIPQTIYRYDLNDGSEIWLTSGSKVTSMSEHYLSIYNKL